MIAVLTGGLLATAAGLNAYVPLLAMGLLARFIEIIDLPDSWSWLSADWALILLTVLLVIEFIVDKFPAVDSINDVLQTLVRPASGGMVFAAGVGSDTVAMTDPEAFSDASGVWPIVIGVIIALVPHIFKTIARPVINSLSGGLATPLVSTAEDTGAVGLTVFAVIAPILGTVFLIAFAWLALRYIRKARLSRREPGLT